MKQYGYVRISSKDQNPDRQLWAMQEERIPESDIFLDRMSGKDFSRPQYGKLLKILKKGDTIVIKSIDRLGRNYGEILEQWRKITKVIGADIRVLDMPLLNTRTEHADLTGEFIADLVLQILAYVAETERSFIRQRQAEGIAAAKQKGVKFGRQEAELPDDFKVYYKKWSEGDISIRKAAKALHMSSSTFYRKCQERMQEKEKGCENCSK